MRTYVFDLKKAKGITFVFKVVIVLAVVLGISTGAINTYFASDYYIEASSILNEQSLIIIDAGHGGEDCGTIGADGTYEKDLNLEYAFLLGEMLSNEGFAVVYTRTEDRLLYTEEENIKGIRKISDLKNRCKIAAEYPNSIFISLHMNSYSNPKYKGLQVYYSEKNSDSYILASSVQMNVKNELQTENNRKIKAGKNIYILENIDNPAILIECGFLSNPEECSMLAQKEYQKSLCFSIICGIIEYKERTANR